MLTMEKTKVPETILEKEESNLLVVAESALPSIADSSLLVAAGPTRYCRERATNGSRM